MSVDIECLRHHDRSAHRVWETFGVAQKYGPDETPAEGLQGVFVLYTRTAKPHVAVAIAKGGHVEWGEELDDNLEVQDADEEYTVTILMRKQGVPSLINLRFDGHANYMKFASVHKDAAEGRIPGLDELAAAAQEPNSPPPVIPTPGAKAHVAAPPPMIPTPGSGAGRAAPPAIPTPGAAFASAPSSAPPMIPTPGSLRPANGTSTARSAPPAMPTPGDAARPPPPAIPTPGSTAAARQPDATACFPSTPHTPSGNPLGTLTHFSAAPSSARGAPPPIPTPGSLASTARHISSAPPPVPTPTSLPHAASSATAAAAAAQPAYTAAAPAHGADGGARPSGIHITPPTFGPGGWKSGPDLNELRMSVIKIACSDNTSVATLQAMLQAYQTAQ